MPDLIHNSSKLILIVDDDPIVGEVISYTLESAGYQIRLFQDPEQVIDVLLTLNPEPVLLLADYNMPRMNGLELIQHCKSHIPKLRAVSLSGSMTAKDPQNYRIKPDRTLAKPFVPDELLTLVNNLLAE